MTAHTDSELLDRVLRGVASTQEADQAREAIAAMRKDAARYEWLREHLGQLVVHTIPLANSQQKSLVALEVGVNLQGLDPQSVDQCIDSILEHEDKLELAAHPERDA